MAVDTKSPISGTELDLSKGEGHNHPDITPGHHYLCLIGDGWFFGTFDRQWFGLSFRGWFNVIQYDTPGTNKSNWPAN